MRGPIASDQGDRHARLLLALLAGCSPRDVVVHAESQDLVVVVPVSPSGKLKSPRLLSVESGAVSTTHEEFEAEDTFVALTIPHDRILAQGPRALESPRAVFASDRRAVGCGRCLAGDGLPQLSPFDGDVCAIPSWATGTSDGDPSVVETVRQSLAVAFSGECACAAEFKSEELELTPTIVVPPGAHRYTYAALLDDGTLGLFGTADALAISPAGVETLVPSPGRPIHAVGALGRRFLVARQGARLDRSTFELLDADLQMLGVVESGTNVMSVTGLDRSGLIAVTGSRNAERQAGVVSSLVLCETDPFVCAEIAPTRAKEPIMGVAQLENGLLVGLQGRPGFIVYPSAIRPSEVRGVSTSSVLTTAGEVPFAVHAVPGIDGSGLMGAVRNRVFACSELEDESARVFTASVSLTRALVDDLGFFPDRYCIGFLPFEDGIELVLRSRSREQTLVLRFDERGTLTASRTVPLDELPRPLWAGEQSGRVGLLVDETHRVLRRLPGGPLETIWSEAPNAVRDGLLVSHRGRGWLVGATHRVRLDGPYEPLPGGFGLRPYDAVSDGQLIYGLTAEGIVALDPESAQRELFAPAEALGARLDSARLGAVAPATLVMAAEGDPPTLSRVSAQGVVPFVISWDDPTTPEEDDPRAFIEPSKISSSLGVAWLSTGYASARTGLHLPGSVLRLLPWLEPPLAYAYTSGDPRAVAPICADRAILFESAATESAFFGVVDLEATRRSPLAIGLTPQTRYDVRSETATVEGAALVSGQQRGAAIVYAAPKGRWLETDGVLTRVEAVEGGFWIGFSGGQALKIELHP